MREYDSSRYEPENGQDMEERIGRGPAKHRVQTMRARRTTDVGHGARGEPRRGSGRTPEKAVDVPRETLVRGESDQGRGGTYYCRFGVGPGDEGRGFLIDNRARLRVGTGAH